MNRQPILAGFAAVACAVALCGCAAGLKAQLSRQTGESVVFIGEEPAALAHLPSRGRPIQVRTAYQPAPGAAEFVEGRDFVMDYANGTLRRTPHSTLPDFRKNILFGHEDFDHSKFPGFGNGGFFAFADYSFRKTAGWPSPQANYVKAIHARLAGGEAVKIVAFGDSITAGGDATKPELVFWRRWADQLQRHHPSAHVTAVNGATSGDSTVQGLQRLQTKVLDEQPDLVLIGFGMNDHKKGGVAIPQFEENLRQMIDRIRDATHAEIVLFSAFPPNPKWHYGSHHMQDYAVATERVARETACAYADVFGNWQAFAARKKPEDLLGNNINHPNDFGHWIYWRTLSAMGL